MILVTKTAYNAAHSSHEYIAIYVPLLHGGALSQHGVLWETM